MLVAALVVASSALCIAPIGAYAWKYKGYEIVPTPSPAQPASFVAETGPINLESEPYGISCEKEFIQGSFTSATHGTEVERFTGCSAAPLPGHLVRTPGAASGELVTVETPIESVWNLKSQGPSIIVNPDVPGAKWEFIPTLEWGTAKAGPITGSTESRLEPSGVKTTKFTLLTGYINNYENYYITFAPQMEWTNFKGEILRGMVPSWTSVALTFEKAVEFKFFEGESHK